MNIMDKLLIGIVITAAVLLMSTMIYEVVDDGIYSKIESKIVIEERYDGVKNKKSAVDKCINLLETNGYIMCEADTKSHGSKTYVKVKGIKYSSEEQK